MGEEKLHEVILPTIIFPVSRDERKNEGKATFIENGWESLLLGSDQQLRDADAS